MANKKILRRVSHRRRALSLPEVIFALVISTIVMIASMSLFIMTLTAGKTATSIGSTSQDAANAIQKITSTLRVAESFSILDNSTYDAVVSGSTVAVTGLQITYPPNSGTISAVTSTGGATVALSGSNALYDNTAYNSATNTGPTLTFYRSDINGNPAPTNGGYLWMSGTENGVAVSRALIRTVAPEADAIQFIQPYETDGVTPIPNAVKISIVTSSNNGVAGTVTSHSSSGSTSILTGDQVYLRNHVSTGVTSTGVHGHIQIAN